MQKFPDLIIEGCSGSGHIKDFGDIQRVHMIAINDTLSSLPNRQAIYDSTFAFPPAALMDYTYENFYDKVSDAPEPYFWRSSMMNQWQIDPTHSASGRQNNAPRSRGRRRSTNPGFGLCCRMSKYTTFCPARWLSLGWHVLLESEPQARHLIHFPSEQRPGKRCSIPWGPGAHARYKVRTEDHSTPDASYSGTELMNRLEPSRLPGKYTSDLVYLEEAP